MLPCARKLKQNGVSEKILFARVLEGINEFLLTHRAIVTVSFQSLATMATKANKKLQVTGPQSPLETQNRSNKMEYTHSEEYKWRGLTD